MMKRKRKYYLDVARGLVGGFELGWLRGAIILMLLAVLLAACSMGQQAAAPTAVPAAPTAAPAAQPTAAANTSATLQDIVKNPAGYENATVTVSGEVNKIVSPHAFTIGGQDFGAEALIVSKQPLGDLVEGQQETNAWVNGIAQVTGQVQPFDLCTYEKDLGVDLNNNLLQDWSGKPAIMLDSLALTTRQNQQGAGEASNGALSVADIVENPSQYVGKTVTVNGEVEEVYGTTGFKLDEEAPLAAGIDNDLPVIGASQNLAGIDDQILNDRVLVQGTVRMFVKAEIDRDYSWFDATPEVEATFEGKPVLIASSVSPTQAAANGAPGAAAGNLEDIYPQGVFKVSDITGNPAQFDGQQVTLRGEVEEILGSNALKLDDNAWLAGGIDNDLPVISAQQASPALDAGWLNSWIEVKGTVRAFDRTAIEQPIGYALDNDLFTDWDGKPVLVAQSASVVPAGTGGATRVVSPLPQGATLADGTFRVSDITGSPQGYAGKSVSVQGEVENILGPNAFKLDDDAWFAGGIDNDLPVISAQQTNPAVQDTWLNDQVRVTGTVRLFNRAAIEQEIGYTLDNTLFDDWDGKPVLVASNVTTAQPSMQPQATATPAAQQP